MLWQDLGVHKIGSGEIKVTLIPKVISVDRTLIAGEVRIERREKGTQLFYIK